MFDIGFFELLLIAVVGLVVIGPKRLPETIRFLGLWFGRIKRSLGAARQDFEKEFGVDEVRRQLHNEDILKHLQQQKDSVESMNKTAEITDVGRPVEITSVGGDSVDTHSTDEDLTVDPNDSDEKPNV